VQITDANGCTSLSSAFDYLSTGISEQVNNNSLNIYPNPTTGIVNLEGINFDNKNYKIIIYDLFGKTLTQIKNSKTINISAFANGIYYLSIVFDDLSVINKKIILIK